MKKKEWLFPAITGGLLLFGGVLLYYSGAIFLPVCVALVFAYLLNPLVGYLERRGMNRALSSIVVLFTIVLVAAIGSYLFITSIVHEIQNVQISLPDYATRLYGYIPLEVKTYLGIETPEKAYLQLNHLLDRVKGVSFDVVRETFDIFRKAVSSTLVFVLSILGYVVTPLYLYYFLKDLPRMRSGLADLAPDRYRSVLSSRVAEIHEILSGFVRGQLTVCAVLAVLYSVGLWFIGIDLAVVIGTLSGILFIVPYLGTLFGIVFSMTLALLKFHDLLHPLLCLGWFAVVQAIEGGVITPKIVGDKVGLHPVVIIMALLIGGQLFGILGMLLAVPATAVLKVFFSSYLSWYRSSAYFTGA
jgi:predicted PurR-regulated permease PerM